jgi:hypothetical protein
VIEFFLDKRRGGLMKKIILALTMLLTMSATFAAKPIELHIKVSGLSADKPHFLCLYGAGCYNMRSGENGKTFPLNPHVLPNLKKVFIADIRTKEIHGQPISDSCKAELNESPDATPKLTIYGKLSMKDSVAKIEGLRCELS